MRRVVITGIGLMTALGVGRKATWEALRQGCSGVRPINWPEFPDHPVRTAAPLAPMSETCRGAACCSRQGSLSLRERVRVRAPALPFPPHPDPLPTGEGEDGSSKLLLYNYNSEPWPEKTIALATLAAQEAFADAGLSPEEVCGGRFGCTLSTTKGGMEALEAFGLQMQNAKCKMQNANLLVPRPSSLAPPPSSLAPHPASLGPRSPRTRLRRVPARPSPLFWPWPISPDSAGRSAVPEGFCGPMVNVSAACAAGAHSVAIAAQWVRDGLCDGVLCGSAEATLTPLIAAGFHAMGVLADDPPSAFDRRRSGFVLGEGCGAMVVEEFNHARSRGAEIYAEIAGWAMGNDPYHPLRSCPSGEPIARHLRRALDQAGVRPGSPGYINAHGTGTRANDSAEARAIRAALDGWWKEVPVSSTKPATGHALGGSGGIEIALTALALREGLLPPTLNLTDVDPECELRHVDHGGEWMAIDWAASLSMGFGGHIGIVVLRAS